MQSKISKWGNSQGLRLSKDLLALASIEVGDDVDIEVSEHRISIVKVRRNRFDLADLVSRIPANYQPEEVDTGPPVGREEW